MKVLGRMTPQQQAALSRILMAIGVFGMVFGIAGIVGSLMAPESQLAFAYLMIGFGLGGLLSSLAHGWPKMQRWLLVRRASASLTKT